MLCPTCGRDNPAGGAYCTACGTALGSSASPPYGRPVYYSEPKPDNFLVWAILSTLCCCLPAGIVSIVYAAQVDTKYHAGDFAGARQSSENAKLWALISLGLSLVVCALYFVLILVGGIADGGNY